MICFENLGGVFQGLAFAQARSRGGGIDHVRTQSKRRQLEGSAGAGTWFDKKIYQRFPAQCRYLFNFACANLFEGVGGVEDVIDFIDRQLAQPEQIFAVPARGHEKLLRASLMLWVARMFILSPAKRLRSTPLRPAAAVLFHPARLVNFFP